MDIKLLFAFLALMRERSVSRAAERLGISQPTLSHSLNKLRELFDDPLLLRSRGGMIPTQRALRLQPSVETLVDNYKSLIKATHPFNPKNSTRTFVLTAPEHAEHMLIPLVIRKIRVQAPGIRIVVRAPDPDQAYELLERGEIDLRIAWLFKPAPSLRSFHLFQDQISYIADRDHPILRGKLNLTDFISLPHARTESAGTRTTHLVINHAIERLQKKLLLTFQLQNFMTVPMALQGTDIIAAVPRGLAIRLAEKHALQILEPPLKLPKINYSAYWHERNQRDLGHRWLRQVVLNAAQELKS